MSLQVDLSAVVNNDVTYNFNCTYQGRPLNLTGYTITAVLKASRTATDASGQTFTTSSGLTLVSASAGQVSWAIAHVNVTPAGTEWYRLDVSLAGIVTTMFYGNFVILSA